MYHFYRSYFCVFNVSFSPLETVNAEILYFEAEQNFSTIEKSAEVQLCLHTVTGMYCKCRNTFSADTHSDWNVLQVLQYIRCGYAQ
jgi:hypothetical protein